jgi:hypothetical protein
VVKGGGDVSVKPDGSMRVTIVTGSLADCVEGYGRDLMIVLGKASPLEAMAEIIRLCNNNGQIDDSGVPQFSGLQVGITLTV